MGDDQLLVNALENGTVIDHIPAGQAWKIVSLLGILKHSYCVTLGLNLSSSSMGMKDLIKIEGKALDQAELEKVAIFAADATVNIIEQYKIVRKEKATLPQTIEGILKCPNAACISNTPGASTHFTIKTHKDDIYLTCRFCERDFRKGEMHDSH